MLEKVFTDIAQQGVMGRATRLHILEFLLFRQTREHVDRERPIFVMGGQSYLGIALWER